MRRPVFTGLKVPVFRRFYQKDVSVTLAGKTIVSTGPGGRSSRSGFTATVFGASGLLGTHVAHRFAEDGTITIVPYREEMKKRHLKVSGDLGVVNFLEMDLRNVESIDQAVRHSDIVVNCIGRTYETKNFSYSDVHVEGAKRIAQACANNNVSRLIHVSAFNADLESPSEFNRTKALGELVVKDIVPNATIVRPATMFGFKDNFLSRLASTASVMTVNENREVLYPTHVRDVADAIYKIAFDDSTAGELYELRSLKGYSVAECVNLVAKATHRNHPSINLPMPIAMAISKACQYLWWPTICPDELVRQTLDHVPDPLAKTFADLDMTPDALEQWTDHYLQDLRPYIYLHQGADSEKVQQKEKEYVHISY
ncbi:hypothetical protein CANCADRAFT_89015 [Tortispora caseinolytica NRRL Y-17796]|uniref:RmlD-like substrate binding domain-containing protein n=1 Tax=Tortispora caseinolytica NRRL Y-17796 TaxID=767744 RepID=A0A1E4TLB9_9ASCO|nr:hypothetical protein CANCADRAFT_89015 [Tortispora caseinolytica NRRL Y-17796]